MQAALREKSQHKYMVGNVVMPFNPLTYTEVSWGLLDCSFIMTIAIGIVIIRQIYKDSDDKANFILTVVLTAQVHCGQGGHAL